jgi:hypothetical protein
MPDTWYWTGGTGAQSWAGNWKKADGSTGTPATGDTAYIQNATSQISSGLDQHLVTLAGLFIDCPDSEFEIGTATASLQVSATVWTCRTASDRVKIDFGTNAFTGVLQASGSGSSDPGDQPTQILGTHASNSLSVLAGVAGVAVGTPTETAQVPTLSVKGGTVVCGPGVTLGTVVNNGGTLVKLQSAATTIKNFSGTMQTNGAVLVGSAYCYGGTLTLNNRVSGGNSITDLYEYGGTVDFSADPRPVTVATTHERAESGANTKVFSDTQVTHTAIVREYPSAGTFAAG